MKILTVKLKNLNSLQGDHFIDFTQEPLANAGLFAITGPTGSGKSTILDAITLALFGKAARYGTTPSPESMMSRNCGECQAEVEFEVPSGTFRAEWQLRRARGKPEGKVQQAKRFVYDAAGEPLTQKTRETEDKIEELVGLDYTRFLRSALLAQGDFAQFLKADPKERAELLESLTGTTIYSELGRLAHTEMTKRQQKLAEFIVAIDAIQIMEKKKRDELENAIKEAEKKRPIIAAKLKKLRESLSDGKQLEEAMRLEAKDVARQSELVEERKSLKDDLDSLRKHRLTIPFQADLARLDQVTSDLASSQKAHKNARVHQAQTLEDSRASLKRYKDFLSSDATRNHEATRKCKESHEELVKSRKAVQDWLDKHDQDKELPEKITSISISITNLKSQRASLEKDWGRFIAKTTLLGHAVRDELSDTSVNLNRSEAEKAFDGLQSTTGNRIKEVEQSRSTAQKELELCELNLRNAQKVANMEQHRADLEEGMECPLCGSLHHPYREGQPPSYPFQELEKKVSEAKKEFEKLKKALDDFKGLQGELQDNRKSILESLDELDKTVLSLAAELTPFGLRPPTPGEADAFLEELGKRARGYTLKLKGLKEAETKQDSLQQRLEKLQNEIKDIQKKMGKLEKVALPERDPETDELGIGPAKLPSVTSVDEAEASWEQLSQDLTIASNTLKQISESLSSKEKDVGERKQGLVKRLNGSEFSTIETLKEAHLEEGVAKRIEVAENKLTQEENKVRTTLETNRKIITRLRKTKTPEGEVLANLKKEYSEVDQQQQALLEDLGGWQNEKSLDDKNRQRLKEETKKIEKEKKELEIWQRLRGLIGSFDGSTFRRFAQGLSLQILIQFANTQMVRLNDRYRLRRSTEEELEIEILDLHQAEAVRPMRSLSGGESFLASLALALGLSEIAGRKVRIESLFIDEGFGSLDSDTLDIAISALESLRQENKNIGVISHVDLLKERIATQVQVEKHPGGVSSLRVTA